jgi:hypothetical protein
MTRPESAAPDPIVERIRQLIVTAADPATNARDGARKALAACRMIRRHGFDAPDVFAFIGFLERLQDASSAQFAPPAEPRKGPRERQLARAAKRAALIAKREAGQLRRPRDDR